MFCSANPAEKKKPQSLLKHTGVCSEDVVRYLRRGLLNEHRKFACWQTFLQERSIVEKLQLVQSRQNKTVREIIALQDKKERKRQRCFIVEGVRFVREALLSGMGVEKICFATETADKLVPELNSLLPSGIPAYEMPLGLFRQMAETDTPQGVLAVVRIPDRSLSSLYRQGFRGLVLDSVQDPGNCGTMIRSAHALGFDAVIAASGSVDIFNGKVLRATMGSVFHIPVIENVNLTEIVSFAKEHQLELIAACMDRATACHETELAGEFLLAVGNEGKGISEEMLTAAGKRVFIPMPGGAESFNAGVAASILMYESNRQKADLCFIP